MLTSDRDAFQLVSEQVTVLRPAGGGQDLERVGVEGVHERYGVRPDQVPDLIALRGDPSDNIPGARGIGQKTAAELLREHGDLEGVIAAADGFSPARRTAVLDAADQLRDFLRIATMVRDLPVERPPDHVPDWLAGGATCRAWGMPAWRIGWRSVARDMRAHPVVSVSRRRVERGTSGALANRSEATAARRRERSSTAVSCCGAVIDGGGTAVERAQ